MKVDSPGIQTFAQCMSACGSHHGARPAILEKRRGIWRTMTWRDFADEVDVLASALAAWDICAGSHVAVIGENRPRLFLAMAAAHRLGAVAVVLYPDAGTSEIAAQLRTAGARAVFAENQEQVDKLLEALPECPNLRLIVYDDDRGMRNYAQPELVSFQALCKAAAPPGGAGALGDGPAGGDAAFVFFTPGPSNIGRGVALGWRAVIARARALAGADGIDATDVTLAAFPAGWASQTLFAYGIGLVTGQCLCCAESADTLLSDLREIAPTRLLTTPRLLDAIMAQATLRMERAGGINLRLYRGALRHARRVAHGGMAGRGAAFGDRVVSGLYDLLIYAPLRDALGMSRVRSAYCTGDVIAPETIAFFRTIGIKVKAVYGVTEAGGFVAMHRPERGAEDTAVTPLDGVTIALAADGEILVDSAEAMLGYVGDADATARSHDDAGRLRTGDLGAFDQGGALIVLGRHDEVGRLADGTPLAPRPIESRLRLSPYIREAIVVGDARERAAALIDIDAAAVGQWADRQGIAFTGHADLAAQDAVYGLIAGEVAEANAALARDPAQARLQIGRFILLPEELSVAGGALTRYGRLRRGPVLRRHAALVGALFSGQSEVVVEALGATQETPQTIGLKVREAQVVAHGATRRAA